MKPTNQISRLPGKVLLICIFISGLASNLVAQKEGNTWYFGQNGGISFNSGSPVALSNGALVTQEGCSSISDANGNILFYTDGVNVYNRLHNTMPNGTGLLGDQSTSQSALIVAKPGSATLFYIFTLGAAAGGSFCYSIVDMTLAGGNGDVTAKNTFIFGSPLCEKLAGTLHGNGTDVWIAVHVNSSNAYRAYLLTPAGLGTAVVSNVGTVHNGTNPWTGYMKFSPNGNKIGAALYGTNQLDILDFNNINGTFSNPITFNVPPPTFPSYGVEFSSTGQTLYLSNVDVATGAIYQLNLNAGSTAAILASATLVHTFNTNAGALQIGPDNKIYFSEYINGWLGVINNPDSLGLACNPVDQGVNLGTGVGRLGLPNFISNIFKSSFSYVKTCLGDTTVFNVYNTVGLLGALWDFGDTASGTNNFSTIFNPLHHFSSPGTYMVQVIKYYAATTDTVIVPVIIHALPVVNLGSDTTICSGTSYLLNAGSGFTSYLWQDGTTASSFSATAAGTYIVTVSDSVCAGRDTVVLGVMSCLIPTVNIASTDTDFCDKHCIDFFDLSTNSPISWQWFFPGSDSLTSTEQNPTGICYNSYGSFDVTLIACNLSGCDTLILPGFINEYGLPTPIITQSNDTLISSQGTSYQWWSVSTGIIAGATNYYYVPTAGGDYFVIITDTVGCAGTSNVINVTFPGIAQIFNQFPFTISPNPNNGSFIISLNTSVKQFSLRIINPIGQIIKTIGSNSIRQNKMHVEIGEFAKGLYVIELISDNKFYRARLMKD